MQRDSTTATPVRVLYVDDGPPASLTDDSDFEVEVVESIDAARSYLLDDAGAVDCVVSEYALPDGSGLALLDTVRNEYPNLPFVVYTSEGNEATASEAVGKGATDYLLAETDGETLRRRVARAATAASVETDSGLSGDRMRELTNAFPDVAFIIDESGRYLAVLSGPGTEDLETVEQERLVGQRLSDAFDDEQTEKFLSHIRRTLESGSVEMLEYRVETAAGERWYEGRTTPLGEPIDGRKAVVWVARDVTERRESERELAASRDELATLNRINGLINSILQSLVGSATREEIEQTVCAGLANSEFYEFAWAGTPWTDEEDIRLDAIEGVERSKLERLVEVTTDRGGADDSINRVVRTGESVVVPDVGTCSFVSEAERDLMLEMEMSSAVLVPLTYGDANYGVLGISGTRTGAFTDRERVALETLGEIVAFAINAVKNRQLLLSDTTVELEFRDTGSDTPLRRASEERDCRFELEGTVPVSDDRLLQYISVEGISPEPIVANARDDPDVDECRLITGDEDGGLFEVVLGSSSVGRLLDLGTVVQSAVIDDGEVRLVVEAPPDADVREIVDAFQSAYPTVELVGKREVDSPDRTSQQYSQSLTEDLTQKQRTALRASYFAGYYSYPRGSTGEEIAETLDIASPTLHQHLRAAQRKLLGTIFDG